MCLWVVTGCSICFRQTYFRFCRVLDHSASHSGRFAPTIYICCDLAKVKYCSLLSEREKNVPQITYIGIKNCWLGEFSIYTLKSRGNIFLFYVCTTTKVVLSWEQASTWMFPNFFLLANIIWFSKFQILAGNSF